MIAGKILSMTEEEIQKQIEKARDAFNTFYEKDKSEEGSTPEDLEKLEETVDSTSKAIRTSLKEDN